MAYSVGMIGLGNIFNGHLTTIREQKELQISAICDSNADLLHQREIELNCKGYTDYRKMLEEPPDVVVVALPHGLHSQVTVDALESGCHVIVEKPMAVSVDECRLMLAAAKKADRYLNVSEGSMYASGPRKTGEMFRKGLLGRFFTGVFNNSRGYFHEGRPAWFLDPKMSGGGMFSNVGLHRLAMTRGCLPGLKPVSVSASVMHMPEYQVEACTSALVRYAEGGAMHYEEVGYFLRASWWQTDNHYIFENGMVTFDDSVWRMATRDRRTIEEALTPGQENGYDGVYADLLRGIRGEEIRGPQAWEYAVDTSIAQAAYASSKSGHEVDLTLSEWRIL